MVLEDFEFTLWDAFETTTFKVTFWRKGIFKEKSAAKANLKAWKCHHQGKPQQFGLSLSLHQSQLEDILGFFL